MIKLHRILLAGAVLALASSSTMAAGLGAGGLSGSANPVTLTPPGDLAGASQLTAIYTLGGGSGSLTGLSGDTTSTVLDVSNAANIMAFSLTNGSNFTFDNVTDYFLGGYSQELIPGSGIFIKGLNVFLTGTVTYNGESSTGILSLTFTQVGNATTGAGLSLQVAAVPEPSSVALAGIGLAAAGLFGLRKRLAK